jgi:hypothetical protein
MTRRVKWCIGGWLILTAAGWITGLWLFAALSGLALAPLPFVLAARRGGRADPMEPLWAVCALFAFSYLLVPPLESLNAADFISLGGYLELPGAQLQFATTICGLAFLALLWGYFGSPGAWLGRHTPALRSEPGDLIVGGLAAVLFGLGVAAVGAAVVASGVDVSPGAISSGALRNGIVTGFAGRGYLSVGLNALSLSPPVATLWLARRPGRLRIVLVAALSIVAFGLLLGIVGSRILALQIPIMVAVIVHYRIKRLPLGAVLMAGLVIGLLGVAILTIRRHDPVPSPLGAAGALGLTLDGFNYFTTALARTHHFLWGQTVFEDAAYTYVPRGVWSGKPLIYGIVRAQEAVLPGLARDVGGTKATYPVGIVAEGYVNMGIAGVLALSAAAGALFRAARDRAAEASPIFLILLAWLIPNALSVMRGFGPTIPGVAITMLLASPLAVTRLPRRRA